MTYYPSRNDLNPIENLERTIKTLYDQLYAIQRRSEEDVATLSTSIATVQSRLASLKSSQESTTQSVQGALAQIAQLKPGELSVYDEQLQAWISTLTASLTASLLPSLDDTYDIGAAGLEWRNLYIDGTATIDALVADTADVNGGTIDASVIGGTTPAAGHFTDLSATGDVDLGNAATDSITATGYFDSDLIPLTDGTYDLGSGTNEWQNLYIDGTAYLDTVDIDAGNIDGTIIGAATPAAITATTVTATGALGCNGATAQTAYASGGALAAYSTGAFGLDSDAHMQALFDLVVKLRACLVANGIMS